MAICPAGESDSKRLWRLEAFAWNVVRSLRIHGPEDPNSHMAMNQLWAYLSQLEEEREKVGEKPRVWPERTIDEVIEEENRC